MTVNEMLKEFLEMSQNGVNLWVFSCDFLCEFVFFKTGISTKINGSVYKF